MGAEEVGRREVLDLAGAVNHPCREREVGGKAWSGEDNQNPKDGWVGMLVMFDYLGSKGAKCVTTGIGVWYCETMDPCHRQKTSFADICHVLRRKIYYISMLMDGEEERKAMHRIRRCQNYPTIQIVTEQSTPHRSHHLGLIPGIFSPSSASPPECRFLPTPPLTGEFPTKVGPLDTGLPKAGVEVLFVLHN